jgi:hypothetical protein
MVVFGFYGYVSRRLLAVFVPERWRKISFPVLASVNKGDDVIQIPRLASQNLALCDMADAAVSIEDTGADMRGRSGVVRLANPFLDGPHAAASISITPR